MILEELLRPTPRGSLDGKFVEALSDLPDDEPPTREGNDAIHAPGAEAIKTAVDMRATRPGARVVPFVRTLRRGMTGQDVIAVQRALQAAGVRKMRPSGWYGPVMFANVKRFQTDHKLKVTGVYDLLTHHMLVRYFDSYGAFLMLSALKAERKHEIRVAIVAAALFGYDHRQSIHYTQGPQRLDAVREHLRPPHFPVATDCSGFDTWCYQVGHGPDPCGSNYDVRRPHWTGAIAIHGVKVQEPSLADLLLYGRAPDYEHVAIYVGNGKCISQGSEPGPLLLPVHYRPDFAMARSYV